MKSNSAETINKYESCFYFFAWLCAIIYSAYEFHLSNNYFDNYFDAYNDFNVGWIWIGKKQDISDQEWRAWLALVNKLIPCIFVHHFISQIIKINNNDNNTILCCWYILSSIAFVYYYLGILSVLCVTLQPSLIYILTCTHNKSVIWIIHILYLFIIHILKIPDGIFQSWLKFNDDQHYILTLTMCWIHLRSISYNMDNIDDNVPASNNFIKKLAYCLYLPTLFLGPLILYHEFQKSINKSYQYLNCQTLLTFILNLIRYTFWLYFTELLLHFIYVNAIQYHPQAIQNLNPWAFYGLGYCMGQFFLNKYVVIYGTSSTLCNLDNIKAPPQPKCIARIHLYSDMWKHFDRGLYNFLTRYIYIPMQKSNGNYGKLFASFLCFVFIFIWHGIQMNIFIWALLNFVGVTFESIGKLIAKSELYQKIMLLSPKNIRRLHCILASPLLALSAISNFYFFGGQEIGNIFVQRLLHESMKTLCLLLFFLYCCCQVSIDIKSWEKHRITL